MPTGAGRYGICSTPVIEGDRVYIVGSTGDMLCLDLNGQADGNDGPFTDEAAYFSTTNKDEPLTALKDSWGDIIWAVSMRRDLGVEWHDAPSGSPLLLGDRIWVTTSQSYHTNEFRYEDGVLREIDRWGPNIVVFDKHTGKVLATDDIVVPATFHGQWSSLSSGVVNDGERRVFWGDGYGYLRAFSTDLPERADAEGPATIKQLWWCDVNPPDYRLRDGVALPYPTWRDSRGIREGKTEHCARGPCEIIATPVFWDHKVYAILGRDYMYQIREDGRALGDSHLVCIDASVTLPEKRRFNPPPDVTDQAILWSTREVGRGMSSMAIDDGLLYVADTAGELHCFDARTGKKHWKHDIGSKIWASSPLVADGKVYLGTSKADFFIFRAGAEKELLYTGRTRGEITTPTAVDGALYIFSARQLNAYGP
jgi:outer membrane protein assembly factor BamB